MSLTCTLSLARKVEPLSTRCLATILVTLSAAFFGEWRFSRRMLLFVHLSFASLASYSTALTVYVFYPNNHFCLASFCEPNSLACQVLSTFHNIPEQSFAFCIKEGFEPSPIPHNGIALPLSYLRTYQDVLLQLLHTLLDTEYNTPHAFCLASYSTVFQVSPHRFNYQTSTQPFCANSRTLYLPVDHQHSQVWYVIAWPPQPLGTHRLALFLSFRTITPAYCLSPTITVTRVAFALRRVNPDPGLHKWTLASAGA